jgi:serine/threonine protein kinase
MAAISPERWREVSPYLDHALCLSEAERTTWIDSLRAEHAETAALLEELLKEHRALAQEHFLEQSPVAPPVLESSLAGQTVGAYTLISSIGQGGMGTVWLAARSDGRFDRRVAIKFLNFAMAQPGAERFKREGKILARLAHPHIAQMIDAGVSASAQPYLVLEYCDGEHIDRYCDRERLDVDARIRLFLDVLSAVAHAHSNLIVHRDIKPSNVIVANNGDVKLLDFGIAKLLVDDATPSATLLTLESGAGLTPQFAAPEQITGGAITTATDVYSLGVLLYLLLTGQHPAGAGPHSPADLVKAITETEPSRASEAAALSSPGQDAAALASNRGASPDKLRRQLRGDLDTILAKSLKKSPEERYSSVTAFADDLRRYLNHEPIKARPDTFTYRTVKFLRRNRTAAALAILVVASLSAGLFVANRERKIAQQRFDQLQGLSTQVFDLDTAIQNLPGSTQVQERLVSIALQYLDGLAANAHGDLDLTEELGEGYWRVANVQGVPTGLNLGQPEKAEANLKRAEQLVDRVLASRPRDRNALLHSAEINQGRMILAQEASRDADALVFAQESGQRLNQLLSLGSVPDSERKAAAAIYLDIALADINMHLYAEAIPSAQRAIELAGSVPSARIVVAGGLSLLANAERYQGDLDAALRDIREARRLDEAVVDPNPVFRATKEYGILLREGYILGEDEAISLGRPKEAVVPLREAFRTAEALAEKDPHDAVSRARVGTSGLALGNILREWDPQGALAVYDLALKRNEEISSSSLHTLRHSASLLANSSYALRDLHRLAEARRRVDRALAVLGKIGDLPAERIRLGSAAFIVCRADADDVAETDGPRRATGLYELLLVRVIAAKPAADTDLRNAPHLSQLYASLASLYRRTGETAKAQDMESRRLKLWQGWDRKLPANAFIRRQLAAAAAPTA